MLQFVLRWEKDSVAAMKMLTSCFWVCWFWCGWVEAEVSLRDWDMASTPEVEEGMAFGSMEEVLRAGPESFSDGESEGEGGGVG